MSTPIILAPLEDACVNSNKPTARLNGQGLGIGKWNYINRSLLKFSIKNLKLLPNSISSVELRLYGKALYTPITVNALFTVKNFKEKAVSWITQPPPSKLSGKDVMGSFSNVSTSLGWFYIPIDPVFLIARMGSDFLIILESNRESGVDNYCYAADKEGEPSLGPQYAPKLAIKTRAC